MNTNIEIRCKCCGKKPNELNYYITQAQDEECTPDDIARQDGTYNFMTKKFYCMVCYVGLGCPLGTA